MTDFSTVVCRRCLFVLVRASLDNQTMERRSRDGRMSCIFAVEGGSIYIRYLYAVDEFLYIHPFVVSSLRAVAGRELLG